jgi:hypothetical protein
VKPHDPALLPATNGILQEFADLLRVITLAGADHEITAPEARDIRARWEDLKSVTEAFVHAAEGERFAAPEARNVELRMTDETEPTGTSAVPGLSGGGE